VSLDLIQLARIFSFLAVLTGIVMTYYLRNRKKIGAVGIGASVASWGVVILLGTYSLLSLATVLAGLMVVWFAFTISLYVTSGSNPRTFALLGIAIVLALVNTDFLPLPRVSILIYAALSLSAYDALDYSRIDVTACMAKADPYLSILLWPFSVVERSIKRATGARRTRLALSIGYFTFGLAAMIALPFLLAGLFASSVNVGDLILVFLVAFVASREECNRAFGRLAKHTEGATPL